MAYKAPATSNPTLLIHISTEYVEIEFHARGYGFERKDVNLINNEDRWRWSNMNFLIMCAFIQSHYICMQYITWRDADAVHLQTFIDLVCEMTDEYRRS